MKKCETPIGYLTRIEKSYVDFVLKWENSKHEPTKVVSLFLKYTNSYLRCKHGIRNVDFWLFEKESCEWMSAWKKMNKGTECASSTQTLVMYPFSESSFNTFVQGDLSVRFCGLM